MVESQKKLFERKCDTCFMLFDGCKIPDVDPDTIGCFRYRKRK